MHLLYQERIGLGMGADRNPRRRSSPPAPPPARRGTDRNPRADRARARIDLGMGGLGEQIDPCTLSGTNPSDGQRNRRRGVGALPVQELATSMEP